MHASFRVFAPVALGLLVVVAPLAARAGEFVPKPETYLCPHATGGAIDCYLHAVAHLYTMCRQVKSIEIIEFGYEKSAEGTNGAKSEYCVDKHKLSMARPYQAALKEATPNPKVVDGLRALQDQWLKSLAELKWIPGESDEQYKARVSKPYEIFSERAIAVRAVLPAETSKPAAPEADKGKKEQAREAATEDEGRDLSGAAVAAAAESGVQVFERELAAILGEDGILADALPGFRFRPQQLAMAHAVADAITRRGALIAEAGTGTGKTFAYLVPALLYGGKVIVSTGTKTLQDQLFQRDLPLVRDALKVPVTLALLKGRANYVCHHHLERTAADGRLPSREDARHLPKIIAFARVSDTGDRGALADVPENASIWPLVTSTRDNCLGAECAFHADCFVLKARKAALEADVVVVNHHLFFADVMLRDEGLAELLPACNTLVLDEAHQLPDTATLFFGEELSSGQLAELARDAEVAARTGAREVAELPAAAEGLGPASRKLRLALGDTPAKVAQRVAADREGFVAALDELTAALDRLAAELGLFAERSEDIANCAQRAGAAATQLARWRAGLAGNAGSNAADDPGATAWIRWVDVTQSGWELNASPLSVADVFGKRVAESGRAWIFTSATLAVGRDFSLYQRELGLSEAATGSWDSPFDYASQALLYVPRHLPQPNSREHTEAVVAAALPVLRASGGRAFLLFTTLRALDVARGLLAEALAREGLDWPLLVQGEGSRSELLARFRELGNAILLGSASFREGVDVPGAALSVVVLDKLPFAPPDDPLLAARLELLRAEGANPFFDYQLPQAAIALKQGAGRLIRTETDRGVLMICDPRLTDKPYGKRIWQSLPPMRRTRELKDVQAFFGGSEK